MSEDWRKPRVISRAEMMTRVARFKDVKGSSGGLPDSYIPGCYRTLCNVIGFQPPESDDASVVSPVGKDASAQAAINIAEGFNLGFAKAKPGNGPLMHTHNTNETFMPITGTWRCEFNEGDARDHVDLGPLDVVAFPPGMARRFMNVTKDEPDVEHILLFVIAGNAPEAEYTDAAKQFMAERSVKPGAPPLTR
jgi:mannose-6-phosphate isomerase-like protein (cupin superfamily)